jgi:hypothetical protein
MNGLSISRAWDEAKAIMAREGHLLAAVALALVVLPQLILAVVGVPMGMQANPASQIVYIAAVLLGFVAQIALNRLAIGPSVRVADAITQGFTRVLPVFLVLAVVMVMLGIIVVLIAVVLSAAGVGMLPAAGKQPPAALLIILILLTAAATAIFQLVFPIAAAETGNPIRLFTRSWQLGRGHYLRLLAFIMTVFVTLGIVAALTQLGVGSVILLLLGRPTPGSLSALLVGIVAGLIQAGFTVVVAVMQARIYVQIAGGHERRAESFR